MGNRWASDWSSKLYFGSRHQILRELKAAFPNPLNYQYQSDSSISSQKVSISPHHILHARDHPDVNEHLELALLFQATKFFCDHGRANNEFPLLRDDFFTSES